MHRVLDDYGYTAMKCATGIKIKTAVDVMKKYVSFESLPVKDLKISLITAHWEKGIADCDGHVWALLALGYQCGWNNLGIIDLSNHVVIVIKNNNSTYDYWDFGIKRTADYYIQKYRLSSDSFNKLHAGIYQPETISGKIYFNQGNLLAALGRNEAVGRIQKKQKRS
ncbi:MAG: hypothetical protein ABIH39_03990 [Candidatus Margulisiibacteriota bacterium]